MRILYIILHKYLRLSLSDIETFEMDCTNPEQVIIGTNGSGKSSIVDALAQKGYQIFKELPKTKEELEATNPDSLEYAIRSFLQQGHKDDGATRNILSLMFTKMRKNYQPRLLEMLAKGNVVMDRGILSTMVYGMTANLKNNKAMFEANLKTQRPDIIIYLQVDLDTAMERIADRDGHGLDEVEVYKKQEPMVKNLFNYNYVMEEMKDELNIVTIDAMQSPEKVLEDVLRAIQ